MLHPAYLWIGSDTELTTKALSFIKSHVCKQAKSRPGGCTTCIDCAKVERKQHHLLLWVAPENTYTISLIEEVLQKIVFALERDEHFFIVFEHAELFNTSCANSLLKSLEEPPPGYHFILLAPRTEGILPTIRSRCITQVFKQHTEQLKHSLFSYFTPVTISTVQEFTKELERVKMAEREIQPFLDQLTDFWYLFLKEGYAHHNEHDIKKAYKALEILHNARALPVMPGSSKIFLKNLYLCLSIAF